MLAAGALIAGYRIEGMLGRGGMGTVYEATQVSLGRKVALKLLDASLSDDESFRERFRREGRIQAALDHPHIITVFDTGETDEGLFLAMRLVSGRTLKELIRAREVPVDRALRLLRQVGDALDVAHEAGLIHRDVKPQNILVGPRDHAYLADFGVTKAAGDTGLTRTGVVVGTVDYIAPEQIRGEDASPASDVYSFGAVAYEALTGEVPFPKPTEAAILYAHMAEPPAPASARADALPREVDAVLDRALAKDPGQRTQSPLVLVEELEAVLGAPAPRAATPPAGIPVQPPPAVANGHGDSTEVVERRPMPAPPPDDATEMIERPPPPTRETGEATEVVARPAPPEREPEPEPEREPEPEPAAVRTTRRPSIAVLAAGGLAVLALVAFAIGSLTAPSTKPAPTGATRTVAANGSTLTVPAAWHPADAPATLGLKHAVAAGAPGGGTVTAGSAPGAAGPYLLPASIVRTLTKGIGKRDAVRLRDLPAYRYRDLQAGGHPLTVYAASTTDDPRLVVCSGVSAEDCDRSAASLRADAVKPRPLGPDAAYAKHLGATAARLDRARAAAQRDLRRATRRSGQAKAARRVANAYGVAVKGLGGLDAGAWERAVQRTLRSRLAAARSAYAALADAAGRGAASAYARARTRAAQADAGADAALRAYRQLGYRVG